MLAASPTIGTMEKSARLCRRAFGSRYVVKAVAQTCATSTSTTAANQTKLGVSSCSTPAAAPIGRSSIESAKLPAKTARSSRLPNSQAYFVCGTNPVIEGLFEQRNARQIGVREVDVA